MIRAHTALLVYKKIYLAISGSWNMHMWNHRIWILMSIYCRHSALCENEILPVRHIYYKLLLECSIILSFQCYGFILTRRYLRSAIKPKMCINTKLFYNFNHHPFCPTLLYWLLQIQQFYSSFTWRVCLTLSNTKSLWSDTTSRVFTR